MKCANCPLAFEYETDWETGECELTCAVTMSAVLEGESCSRTDKWINSQDIEKVKEKYYEGEAKYYEEYFKKLDEERSKQYVFYGDVLTLDEVKALEKDEQVAVCNDFFLSYSVCKVSQKLEDYIVFKCLDFSTIIGRYKDYGSFWWVYRAREDKQ